MDRCITFHFFARLAGLEHELPAFAVARRNHVGCRPLRVTEKLDVIDRPRHALRIDDQPVLRICRAFELLTNQRAYT